MKIRCIKACYNYFTQGEEYEVIKDKVKTDGMQTFDFYGSIEKFNEHMSSKFELVKESNNMKFKVGDKVKVLKDTTNQSLRSKFIGEIAKVVKADERRYNERTKRNEIVYVLDITNTYIWHSDELELEQSKQLTLSDIKERWLVVFANGKEAVAHETYFHTILAGKEMYFGEISKNQYNDDLTDKYDKQWNIVKVLKPRYEEVWTRPEEFKKDITMEEIIKDYEERNKCKVNITKGDK